MSQGEEQRCCVVVDGESVNGRMVYEQCGEPATAVVDGYPMCEEHAS